MYSPNQVGELIIGQLAGASANVGALITANVDKTVQVFSHTGVNAPAANTPWKAVQITSGTSAKGLNYEFSDIVDPIYTESVLVTPYAAEVQKVVTVTGTGYVPLANTTYELTIYLYEDGGSLSPENFAQIQGYYVTGVTAPTLADLLTGLTASLNYNLSKRGGGEFTATTTATVITITSIYQNVVPGKIIGTPLAFDVKAPAYANASNLTQPAQNLNPFVIATTVNASPGNGTAKYAINFEWFIKGMKYEVYRQTGYPADFNTPYYASKVGVYNTIKVKYFKPRNETSVERQYKILTILMDKVTDVPANNAATNTVLSAIRVATGTNGVVSANLAVV